MRHYHPCIAYWHTSPPAIYFSILTQGIHIFTSISTLPLAMTHLMPLTFAASSLPFMPFCSGTADWCARFGAHLRQLMKWECASSMVRTHRPCCSKSQHRMVLSSEDESKNFPPGWNAIARTQLSCPACLMSFVRSRNGIPVFWMTHLPVMTRDGLFYHENLSRHTCLALCCSSNDS